MVKEFACQALMQKDTVIGLGMTSLKKESYLFYPNPFNEFIVIKSGTQPVPEEIEFYSLDGRLVKCLNVSNNVIGTKDLKKGIYILLATNGDGSVYRKIVVKP